MNTLSTATAETLSDNPEWLNEILETLSMTEGVDSVDYKPAESDPYCFAITVDCGEESFEFDVTSDGIAHGIDYYDGNIFDLTTQCDAQWYFASELYMRLQQVKKELEELKS